MYIAVSIFNRGRLIQFHERDLQGSRMVYLRYARTRRRIVTSSVSLESSDDGGLQFLVFRNGKTQGWGLRGPIHHWESSY